MKNYNKNFATILKTECLDINNAKLSVLLEYSKIIDSAIERGKNMFIKGYTYNRVYERMPQNMSSTYKAKCLNVASHLYKNWCKTFKVRPKQDKIRAYGSASKCWVYKNQIKDFSVSEDTSKMFQLRVRFSLPCEIQGYKELTLMSRISKKDIKAGKLDKIYKDGFMLVIKKNRVFINLVQKIESKPEHHYYAKAIYASTFGGIHVATCNNLETLSQEQIKEFYSCNYGVSRESKDCLELIEKIKSMTDTENYKKNLDKLGIKIRTRVNKMFKRVNKKNCSTFYFVKTTGNTSKVTEFIQTTALSQLKKLCLLNNCHFEVVYVDAKELDKEAVWCMTKTERQDVKLHKRKVTNRFRVIAGLKKFMKEHLKLNVRLGYKKSKSNCSTEVLYKDKQSIATVISSICSNDDYEWQ